MVEQLQTCFLVSSLYQVSHGHARVEDIISSAYTLLIIAIAMRKQIEAGYRQGDEI